MPVVGKLISQLALPVALMSVMASARVQAEDTVGARADRCVILLHGLFRSSLSLKPMQWFLDRDGYTTVNLSYPSLLHPIPELAEDVITNSLRTCHARGAHKINFVTHSLGGILVRQYASVQPIQGMQRAVMLGPPNGGSQVAEYYGSIDFLSAIEPMAIRQLGTGEESIPRSLGPVEFELGVIAGGARDSTLLPGFPDEPSDGTVSLAEAVVPGMLDFLQMPVTHTFMIWNPKVMHQVGYFLEYGTFEREM
ncbi:alpha/beta hydrolase [Halioglobus maricola]|uniref:Alpha/beta hydrolase n=1 Tax=Halioglobus maricola TaxID=2601894 RepID=A0A5P9NJR4_9GAMM|nr:alpha/beta hydrolase [Halioglobus maricola]QFU75464.1 alpha/beta hydrolase [Halioglobus maricola]